MNSAAYGGQGCDVWRAF